MKKLIAVAATLAFVGMIAGCNTMGGFGKDVEKTGEAVQKKAQ